MGLERQGGCAIYFRGWITNTFEEWRGSGVVVRKALTPIARKDYSHAIKANRAVWASEVAGIYPQLLCTGGTTCNTFGLFHRTFPSVDLYGDRYMVLADTHEQEEGCVWGVFVEPEKCVHEGDGQFSSELPGGFCENARFFVCAHIEQSWMNVFWNLRRS